MSRRHAMRLMLAATLGLAPTTRALAARSASNSTTIYVKNMHCPSCAKPIARKLYAVKGVVSVKINIKASTVHVSPQQRTALSPRALWEAVESAKFKPHKLVGPNGTYTKKPPV